MLEGIGGRTHRAGCMVASEARNLKALPIGLARGARLHQPVPKGSLITYDMGESLTDTLVWRLRMEQDKFCEERANA